MSTIIVNATSLKYGGALTILKEYFEKAEKDFKNQYIFFVDEQTGLKDIKNEKDKNIILYNQENRFYKNKFYWNLFGFSKMIKKNWSEDKIIIFSLQNFHPFGTKKIPKIVYLHQAIPFFDYKWGFFNKEERVFWFYKNIYVHLILKSLKDSEYSIVQTRWLKKKLLLKNQNFNIKVERPNINEIFTKIESKCVKQIDSEGLVLFYPAAPNKYKNHYFLFLVLNKIIEVDKNYKLYLTFNPSKEIYDVLKKLNIEKNVIFLGNLSLNEIKYCYEKADIVLFPSLIESFGLPLIEAKEFKKKIIVNNIELYKEVVGEDYNLAIFHDLKVDLWTKEILKNNHLRS